MREGTRVLSSWSRNKVIRWREKGWDGGEGMANRSPIPVTSSALTAVPFAVYLCAIILSFLPTSPLAPVACPDHNSAAQGEKKNRPLCKPLLNVHTHFRHVHVCGHVYDQVRAGHSASWVLFSWECGH